MSNESLKSADGSMDRLLARVLPMVDPPRGELPDPNLLSAWAEGRLPQREADRLQREVAASPAARAELRDLYPETFAAAFPDPAPRATRRWRGPLAGVLTLAAAAAIAFFVVPPSPPTGPGIEWSRDDSANAVRGAVAPGQRFAIRVRLGQVTRLDALRGRAPWGALLVTDPSGTTRVLCSTTDLQRCTAADGTLGYLFVSPSAPGEYRMSLLSAPEPIERATLTRGLARSPDPQAALNAVAEAHHGVVTETPPIRVE